MSDERTRVAAGATVYDDDGRALGTVRGIDDDGFVVTTRDGVSAMSIEHERAGHEFGEAELTWRCGECGEMGPIDELPEECPNCGADRTEIFYAIED
jgi:rubredoxin